MRCIIDNVGPDTGEFIVYQISKVKTKFHIDITTNISQDKKNIIASTFHP